jgi:hypothetical protein
MREAATRNPVQLHIGNWNGALMGSAKCVELNKKIGLEFELRTSHLQSRCSTA